jgi:hypothetical protein
VPSQTSLFAAWMMEDGFETSTIVDMLQKAKDDIMNTQKGDRASGPSVNDILEQVTLINIPSTS